MLFLFFLIKMPQNNSRYSISGKKKNTFKKSLPLQKIIFFNTFYFSSLFVLRSLGYCYGCSKVYNLFPNTISLQQLNILSVKFKLWYMNKKSFFWGFVTGVILTFAFILIYGLVNQYPAGNEPVQYLDEPVSYENKSETSFKVFQVFDDGALANEISDKIGNRASYLGNTVVILGENYYSDQVVTIKNPQRVGTYSYTNNSGMPMTVPIIDGDISE